MTIPQTINGLADGVPQIMRPIVWDIHLPTETNLNIIEAQMGRYREYLPEGARFDEAAIQVPGPWHVERLTNVIGGPAGWVKFNEAEDLVFTNPFGTRYRVRYHFFRHPNRNYRLEIMHPEYGKEDGDAGFSPLHHALWEGGIMQNTSGLTRYPVPHLSFKASPTVNVEGGAERVGHRRGYGLAVQHLRDQGFIHAQTCQSTYGRFGYYLHQDAQRQLYVKPRINTRDDV